MCLLFRYAWLAQAGSCMQRLDSLTVLTMQADVQGRNMCITLAHRTTACMTVSVVQLFRAAEYCTALHRKLLHRLLMQVAITCTNTEKAPYWHAINEIQLTKVQHRIPGLGL